MAAIGTIEIQDNLENQHLSSALIWTVNAAQQGGVNGEAVFTTLIPVPQEVSGARVRINNNYGATGCSVAVRVRCTKVTGLNAAGITKTQTDELLPWTIVALGDFAVSAEVPNLSVALSALLHVDIALVTASTAHLGTWIIPQVRKKAGDGCDSWTDLAGSAPLNGVTAVSCTISSTAPAGQRVIATPNPTTNLPYKGKKLFVQDVADITKSEIVYQTAYGANS